MALDRRLFAYTTLDEYETVLGWTPEQYGWGHLEMSDGVGGVFDTSIPLVFRAGDFIVCGWILSVHRSTTLRLAFV